MNARNALRFAAIAAPSAVLLAVTAGVDDRTTSGAGPVAGPDLALVDPAAAEAFEDSGYTAALALLRTDAAGEGPSAATSRLALGFWAHAAAEPAAAARWLDAAGHGSRWEDWRLFLEADSLSALGRHAEAEDRLLTLLSTEPSSPLADRAAVDAIQAARERGDTARSFQLVEAARAVPDAADFAAGIERIAWEIATETGLRERQREAARRLLVVDPLHASKLKVIELFRSHDGSLDWPSILSPADMLERARRLLEIDLHQGAVTTLEAVPAEARDLEWHLLMASALTADRRGIEALALLRAVRPATAVERARWSLQTAAAELDAGTARPGRSNLGTADRESMRRSAVAHLSAAAEAGAPSEVALEALRRLHTELDDEDEFERSLDVLRRLQQLDPRDVTGALPLWNRGWQEYERRNFTGAIGYWTELRDLYPRTSWARSAHYWSARAHGRLGGTARARELFAEIAAVDTDDFYRRHALAHLGGGVSDRTPDTAVEPWPRDPGLERAEILTGIGLHDLALIELQGKVKAAGEWPAATIEPRAANALEAEIHAARGDHRAAITPVWRAFRNLGTPYQDTAPNRAHELYYPLGYREPVLRFAEAHRLPPAVVLGIIRQESAFDPGAVSRSGARGLMQLMPATGRELAGKLGLPYSLGRLNDPDYSIRLGTSYFRQVLDMFDGNLELALAGYNGGPYRIKKWWRNAGSNPELDHFVEGLSLEETKTYVKRIVLFTGTYERRLAEARNPA